MNQIGSIVLRDGLKSRTNAPARTHTYTHINKNTHTHTQPYIRNYKASTDRLTDNNFT